MQLWCILLPVLAIITSVSTQISSQPTIGLCLKDCLKQGSLIFAASNLRNFWKIVLHFEEFCKTHNKLMNCVESCTEEERKELSKKASLSKYICNDKREEFRLVKGCVENQVDIDSINKCSNKCEYPSDAIIQLDSSPSAPVNPLTIIDGIEQVCRILECVVRCTVTESNKMCAGSGYLFRDIGRKQVLEANYQLQYDAFNSSSANEQQLAKTYLEALPDQCTFIINPISYNTTFADMNDESEMPKEIERNKTQPSGSSTEETPDTFNGFITQVFDTQLTTETTETSMDNDTMEIPETSMTTPTDEGTRNTEEDNDETKPAEADQESEKETEEEEKQNEGTTIIDINQEGRGNDDEMEHLGTSTTAQEITESTMVVVNDDDIDKEIDNNIIAQRTAVQENATKQGVRERITLSLLLILPPISLYLSSNQ